MQRLKYTETLNMSFTVSGFKTYELQSTFYLFIYFIWTSQHRKDSVYLKRSFFILQSSCQYSLTKGPLLNFIWLLYMLRICLFFLLLCIFGLRRRSLLIELTEITQYNFMFHFSVVKCFHNCHSHWYILPSSGGRYWEQFDKQITASSSFTPTLWLTVYEFSRRNASIIKSNGQLDLAIINYMMENNTLLSLFAPCLMYL